MFNQKGFNRDVEKKGTGLYQTQNPTRSSVYSLDSVTKDFGKIRALSQVSLNIERGEIVFVTGASGSGKTTLLRMLAGEVAPDHGKMIAPFNQPTGKRLFISQVFQDLKLDQNKTCEQNLLCSYDPEIYKNKQEFLSDMHELTKILGIHDRLFLKITEANGGLKQKIAIIRALLTRPDILIADEPTSSLDHDNSMKIFEILNLYNVKRNLTVVWASHNRDLVKKFSGRLIHLDQGRLIYTGHACFI